MLTSCQGSHAIYVAEVVGVEAEGTVTVITVCKHCSNVEFHTKQIAQGPSSLRMLKAEKENLKGNQNELVS